MKDTTGAKIVTFHLIERPDPTAFAQAAKALVQRPEAAAFISQKKYTDMVMGHATKACSRFGKPDAPH